MPSFIIERRIGQFDQHELEQRARTATELLKQMSQVEWVRSYFSSDRGKMYCEFVAPNEEVIRELSRKAGLPVDKISRIELEISPQMFT